jgi:hypothetical protein
MLLRVESLNSGSLDDSYFTSAHTDSSVREARHETEADADSRWEGKEISVRGTRHAMVVAARRTGPIHLIVNPASGSRKAPECECSVPVHSHSSCHLSLQGLIGGLQLLRTTWSLYSTTSGSSMTSTRRIRRATAPGSARACRRPDRPMRRRRREEYGH